MNASTQDELRIDRPRSLAATVAERLRQGIIDADLALGEELSEAALAARLGVSRTPVREALSLLQQQGLVVIVPQRGSYVFSPTEQDIIDLCEYRLVLELRAVSVALARRRAAALGALQAAIAAMEVGRAAGDRIAYSREDSVFHDAFIRNCRNRYLEEGYAQVAGQIATLRTHLSVPLPGVQEESFAHHLRIVDAFAAGDVLSIDAVLTEHILATRRSYVTAIQAGMIGPQPERTAD